MPVFSENRRRGTSLDKDQLCMRSEFTNSCTPHKTSGMAERVKEGKVLQKVLKRFLPPIQILITMHLLCIVSMFSQKKKKKPIQVFEKCFVVNTLIEFLNYRFYKAHEKEAAPRSFYTESLLKNALHCRVFFLSEILKLQVDNVTNRSSRSQMFFKIGVLINFAVFTGKRDSNNGIFL